MRFPTTQWNILDVIKAGDEGGRREALGEVISIYGAPLFAFARRQSRGTLVPQDCEDLVNGFFLKCLEGDVLQRADHARGRFRNFLARSFKNYMLNVDRAARTAKGAPGGGFVSLQSLTDDHGPALEPRTNETPEDAFERVLRRSVFMRLLSVFEGRCLAAGQEKKYQLFLLHEIKPRMDGTPVPTYAELARELNLASENAANKVLLAAREEFRTLLVAEVSRDCESQKEAQVECEFVLATALHE